MASLNTPHSLLLQKPTKDLSTLSLSERSSYSFNGSVPPFPHLLSVKSQKPLSITCTAISPFSLCTPLGLSKLRKKGSSTSLLQLFPPMFSRRPNLSSIYGETRKCEKIPSFDEIEQNSYAKYLHGCANETIHGVEYKNYPEPKGKDTVLVADMSSNFCSKPVYISKFGVIYAGAQKNVGPSGECGSIVIIRKDLLGNAQEITPVMLDYKIHADNKSLYNTPPCYAIYICGLVFEDLVAQGGLEAIAKKNLEKAWILYDAIDESGGFYGCPVSKSVRSLMNVPFTLEKSELEADFIKRAASQGMVSLKGHRSVGGVRASIYNAMPLAGVETLVPFMREFKAKHA
ncbi:hypothetical protein AMTRI_Chr03g46510 [Amborella trichopoda]